jgi:hypothetical protein
MNVAEFEGKFLKRNDIHPNGIQMNGLPRLRCYFAQCSPLLVVLAPIL